MYILHTWCQDYPTAHNIKGWITVSTRDEYEQNEGGIKNRGGFTHLGAAGREVSQVILCCVFVAS